MATPELQSLPFKVYARWRPLLSDEDSPEEIDHSNNKNDGLGWSVILRWKHQGPRRISVREWRSAKKFDHVFEATAQNNEIYKLVVMPTLPQVLEGATCNFFAYGHTGSGKTHTIIGYNFEDNAQLGLCLAAARDLFKSLSDLNSEENWDAQTNHSHDFGIGIRMYELRKRSAFDLLNNHCECFVREGPDGRTHIRGEAEIQEDGKVRVRPIVCRPCWTFQQLHDELQSGIQLRATGPSRVHDQSSRTHAVIELEIINKELLEARNAVVERQSELVPAGKYATDVFVRENSKGWIKNAEGEFVQNPDYSMNKDEIDQAERIKQEHEARVEEAEARVQNLLLTKSHPCLGGKLVFVDLAGSEYLNQGSASPASLLKQTPQERQEGRQINGDLFALKEVIRARALNENRVPYRASPLTMVLRDHFTSAATSQSAMILTISPSATHLSATMSALKYGSLVGAASGEEQDLTATGDSYLRPWDK